MHAASPCVLLFSQLKSGFRVLEVTFICGTQAKTIRVTAEASLAQLCDLESKPAEVEVSFGVRLSAGLNAGVLTSGGDANLNVRLLWRADDLAVRSHRKELPSR
jgi:hypothetical protein